MIYSEIVKLIVEIFLMIFGEVKKEVDQPREVKQIGSDPVLIEDIEKSLEAELMQ